eukprot:TRINITY_DN7741_c0_g1_i1.p1 TRINITY_DN7741_c0_g1~~TRINITY_DN7741_c0_g1_i1.p1  ORF type:complete len:476 (+),score=82.87 TRINITY_DN7741_c0_g1_i1:95-1429(+)
MADEESDVSEEIRQKFEALIAMPMGDDYPQAPPIRRTGTGSKSPRSAPARSPRSTTSAYSGAKSPRSVSAQSPRSARSSKSTGQTIWNRLYDIGVIHMQKKRVPAASDNREMLALTPRSRRLSVTRQSDLEDVAQEAQSPNSGRNYGTLLYEEGLRVMDAKRKMAEMAQEQRKVEELRGVTFHPAITRPVSAPQTPTDNSPVFDRLYRQSQLRQEYLVNLTEATHLAEDRKSTFKPMVSPRAAALKKTSDVHDRLYQLGMHSRKALDVKIASRDDELAAKFTFSPKLSPRVERSHLPSPVHNRLYRQRTKSMDLGRLAAANAALSSSPKRIQPPHVTSTTPPAQRKPASVIDPVTQAANYALRDAIRRVRPQVPSHIIKRSQSPVQPPDQSLSQAALQLVRSRARLSPSPSALHSLASSPTSDMHQRVPDSVPKEADHEEIISA